MKGNPLIRLALVLIVLGAVLVPVFRITSSRHAMESMIDAQREDRAPIHPQIKDTLRATIIIHAAPTPSECSVIQGGRTLLTQKDSFAKGEYRTAVEITKGEDLVVSAQWGDEEPHALRTEVLVHGYQVPLEKSFWAQKELRDTMSIPSSFLP